MFSNLKLGTKIALGFSVSTVQDLEKGVHHVLLFQEIAPLLEQSAKKVLVKVPLEALTPWLTWAPRAAGGPYASDSWPEGHANATIFGVRGLEERDDLAIGASLLAPHVRYPDHRHAPEEVYLVLSPGRFQHGDSGWFEPGIGGTLYNRPHIRHAMASDAAPLLALWCLWNGAR